MKTILLVMCLAGCANQRYLTEAEDTALRKQCEPTGCAAVPIPIWEQIKSILQRLRGVQT